MGRKGKKVLKKTHHGRGGHGGLEHADEGVTVDGLDDLGLLCVARRGDGADGEERCSAYVRIVGFSTTAHSHTLSGPITFIMCFSFFGTALDYESCTGQFGPCCPCQGGVDKGYHFDHIEGVTGGE